MKKLFAGCGFVAALVAVWAVWPTAAQNPPFPQTLPANTVVGRTGISAGPAQAIPFSVLFANLFGGGVPPTAHGVVIGEGTSPLNTVVLGDAQLLVGQTSADPAAKTVSGDATMNDAGAVTIAAGAVTGSKIAASTITGSNVATNTLTNTTLAQMAANTVKANATNATANAADVGITSLGLPNFNLAARFGSMDVWQRGAGGSASIAVGASTTAYTVDGCYLVTGANEASTVAAVTGVAPSSFKAAALTRNSGQTGTTGIVFGCPFDSDEIAMFQGSFVTLSFWASTGANWSPASGNLTYTLYCGTGSVKKQSTGYTGQTTPITTTQAITAGSSAARFQSTSAAIVPANCTQAEIQFSWTPVGTAGAADTVTIDDVMLELALNSAWQASPYQHLDFGSQLRLAQRHFNKTFPYGTAPAQAGGSAGSLMFYSQATVVNPIMWLFPQRMRATPSFTTYNPISANANCRDLSAPADLAVTADPNSSSSDTNLFLFCAAAAAAAHAIQIHATADAGI